MRKLLALTAATIAVISTISISYGQSSDEALAIMIPGSGTYSMPISTPRKSKLSSIKA